MLGLTFRQGNCPCRGTPPQFFLKMNEADTCRKYVLPKLVQAGWDNEPHSLRRWKLPSAWRVCRCPTPGVMPDTLILPANLGDMAALVGAAMTTIKTTSSGPESTTSSRQGHG